MGRGAESAASGNARARAAAGTGSRAGELRGARADAGAGADAARAGTIAGAVEEGENVRAVAVELSSTDSKPANRSLSVSRAMTPVSAEVALKVTLP